MSYSEKRNIAFMYEKDGAFTVNDYSKVRLSHGLCRSIAFRQVSAKAFYFFITRVSA